MRSVPWTIAAILALLIITGCSGANAPVEPAEPPGTLVSGASSHSERIPLGFYKLGYDFEKGEITVALNRAALGHYNCTPFATPPECDDCIQVHIDEYDPILKTVQVTVSLKNPTLLTVYDVRGIMHGGPGLQMLHNDGYTKLWSPLIVKFNPFLLYDIWPESDFAPDITRERTYYLKYETFSDLSIDFIIDGCWLGHGLEPPYLRLDSVDDQDLHQSFGTAEIRALTHDWIEEGEEISAECADLWVGEKYFNIITPDLNGFHPDLYGLTITNELSAPPGVYRVELTTVSINSAIKIKQYADVEVHPGDPPTSSLLTDGHPIEGINYHRNNRSQYALPLSLDGGVSIYIDDDDSSQGEFQFSDFVISGDETLYVGYYIFYLDYIQYNWLSNIDYYLTAFQFDDYDPPTHREKGGLLAILNTTGLDTIAHDSDGWSYWNPDNPGPAYSSDKYFTYLQKISPWPESKALIYGAWEYEVDAGEPSFLGDWESREFLDFIPLPEGRLLASYKRPSWDTEDFPVLQVLDSDYGLIQEINVPGWTRGFAYDESSGRIYVSTDNGLYCYDNSYNALWNTSTFWPSFSNTFPVIADDGAILRCSGGVLRRVEPDGTQGGQADCGAVNRPVILNDGTIAVVTVSEILYFDQELNQTGQFPLPEYTGNYFKPPLVGADGNMALVQKKDLYIVDTQGNIIAHKLLTGMSATDIIAIRLGPDHLYVALKKSGVGGWIYKFPA